MLFLYTYLHHLYMSLSSPHLEAQAPCILASVPWGMTSSEAMGFCPPLRMGYFQGRTVNLPEAMCLDFHLLVDYVIHEYPWTNANPWTNCEFWIKDGWIIQVMVPFWGSDSGFMIKIRCKVGKSWQLQRLRRMFQALVVIVGDSMCPQSIPMKSH